MSSAIAKLAARSTLTGAFCALGVALVTLAGVLVLADARVVKLAQATLTLAIATSALATPAGTALAFLLTRCDLPLRRVGIAIAFAALWIPLYAQASGWTACFSVWPAARHALNAPGDGARWLATIWVHACAAVPWVFLIVSRGLARIEPELEELALLDASAWNVFCRVTLPLAKGSVLVAAIFAAISAAGEMTVTDLFRVRTYAEEVYTMIAVEPTQTPLAIAPGIAIVAALVGLAVIAAILSTPGSRRTSTRARFEFKMGIWRWPSVAGVSLILALVVGVPTGSLIWKTGVRVTQSSTGLSRDWSISKCVSLIAESPWVNRREFAWSLEIAAIAASLALVFALVMAWIARRGGRRLLPAFLAVAVPWAIPGPALGLLIVELFQKLPGEWSIWLYDHTIAPVVLAQAIRALPAPTLILWFAFRDLPRDLLEVAAVDGLSPLGIFARVGIPARRGAIASAWLIGFAIGLGELAATTIVRPPAVETLSTLIWSKLHSGCEDDLSSVCLALMTLVELAAAIALLRFRGHRLRRESRR